MEIGRDFAFEIRVHGGREIRVASAVAAVHDYSHGYGKGRNLIEAVVLTEVGSGGDSYHKSMMLTVAELRAILPLLKTEAEGNK